MKVEFRPRGRTFLILIGLLITQLSVSQVAQGFNLAAGVSSGWFLRHDFGSGPSERYFVEPLAHFYLSLPIPKLQVKGTLSFNTHFDQQEMPKAVQIQEQDYGFGLGAGLAYNWIYIPTVTFGGQLVSRTIELVIESPVQAGEDDITKSEFLYGLYVQAGLGIPLVSGRLVIEPFYRYRTLVQDNRDAGMYGLDASWLIF